MMFFGFVQEKKMSSKGETSFTNALRYLGVWCKILVYQGLGVLRGTNAPFTGPDDFGFFPLT